mgnify:CR=1 FL=1
MNFSLSLSVSFLSSLIHSASLIIFLILRFVCSWHSNSFVLKSINQKFRIGFINIIVEFIRHLCFPINSVVC